MLVAKITPPDKKKPPTPEEQNARWSAEMLAAARTERQIFDAVLETVGDIQQELPPPERIILDGPQYVLDLWQSTESPLARSITTGIAEAAEHQLVHVGARINLRPDTPAIVTAGDAQLGTLIREVGMDAKKTVELVVRDATARGLGPAAAARQIRETIGLTERQAQAVINYRKLLQDGHSDALDRALRDRRFDRSVARAVRRERALSPNQIDTMVDAYRKRMLNYRATTIARTESIRALASGNQAAWQALVHSGKYAEGQIKRDWIVARDERTCEICKAIPGLNEGGVGLNVEFQTPIGMLLLPPGHPDCRCTIFYYLDLDYAVSH